MTQEELWRDIGTLQQMHFEFCEMVKKMREAQKNYYKDRPKVGYKVAYQNMINKEQLVDEYLKKMEG